MKKSLLTTLAIVLVLVAVAYIGLQFFLGSVVKAAVNKVGPKITQTKVELASASLSPMTGAGTLSGLYVGNPPGWSSDKAFYLGQMHVDVKPFSIFGDHIILNEVIIDNPEFVYETKLVTSNIGDLLKNIEASTGGKKDEPEAKDKAPTKFEVKRFILKNGHVTIGVGPAAMTLPMPPVTLNDLGTKEGGITANQIAFAVMRSVTTSVVAASTQALGKIGSTTGAAAAETVKQTGDQLKKLFGGKK